MKWYIRYESTDEIDGPMKQELALTKAGRVDGLVFSEEIFDPKFAITEEVEGLLGEMRSLAGMRTTMPPGDLLLQAQDLLKRAIDTIILLSREKDDFPVLDSRLLADLRYEVVRVRICQRAIDMITRLSREKEEDIEKTPPSLEKVAKERLIRDLKECERRSHNPTKALCQRAVQAIQAV